MSNVLTFEETSFDQQVLASDQPVMVDFMADWCPPCKMLAPVVEEIADAYLGKLTVGSLDVDRAQSIAMRYQVMGMPTLGIFKGGTMVDRLVGYGGPGKVRDFVARNV